MTCHPNNLLQQTLHPHHALRPSARPGPPHLARATTRTLPSNLQHQILSPWSTGTLQPNRHDHLGHLALRHLATKLPLPHHRAQTPKDRRRPSHLLHLAAQILLRQLPRQIRPLVSRGVPRGRIHGHPVQLCDVDDDTVSAVVLVPVGERRILDGGVYVGELEWRDVLY